MYSNSLDSTNPYDYIFVLQFRTKMYVLGEVMQNKAARPRFMRAQEVAERLGVHKATAYQIIRKVNQSDAAKGTYVMKGRIRSDVFERVFFPGVGDDARL
jgi:hypothetical protein